MEVVRASLKILPELLGAAMGASEGRPALLDQTAISKLFNSTKTCPLRDTRGRATCISIWYLNMQLSGSLLEFPIPTATQNQIAKGLWDTPDYETLRPYFQYYTEQCRIAFHVSGRQIPVKTHQQIIDIGTHFQNGLSRDAIVADLVSKRPADYEANTECENFDDIFKSSIDLALRLILMLDVGELRNAFSGRRRLIWNEGSVQEFVRDIFSDKISLGHDGVRLGTQFTARNLKRYTRFRIELTTNLADHLRLRYEDRTVSIFHHASFLRCQHK
jgi:hypothetical protein